MGLHPCEMMDVIKDHERGLQAAAPATLTEKQAVKKERVNLLEKI